MREKLVEIFGLKPAEGQAEVSDEQIIAAAIWHKAQTDALEAKRLEEKEITDLMKKACGTMRRETAIEIVARRKGQKST